MQKNFFNKDRKNKKMIIAISVSVAIIVIGLAVFCYFLFANEKENNAKNKAENAQEDPQAKIEEEKEEAKVQLPDLKASQYETDEITTGIDVSEFQGNIDWKAVADSGIDFAMIRVGYRGMKNGEIKEDACAKYNLQEASKNGLKIGAYFFSTAVTEEEAKEEAEWTKNLLSGYPVTYPVAYNCEGFQNPSSRQFELSVEERTKLADAFLKSIEEGSYTGMFYAAKNELDDNNLWNADDLSLNYRIWVAQYSDQTWPEKTKSDYTGDHVMWQYTNQGKLDGIKGAVDFNVAYFGYSQSQQVVDENGAEQVEANVEVGVNFTEVEEQVTAKDEVNLRSTMEQGSDDNIVGSMKNGETAVRTGVGNNGWSRIIYNGQTVYCVSNYLTTDLSYVTPQETESEFKTKFTDVSENVTAKEVTNLRNRPSVESPSEVIAELKNGEVIVRTGVSNEGWSRVEYNGQTLYCISSYLEVVQ
ncbi:SH3 domain-containing protein [Tyzzerella nexilis]|nr:SH3 domain-containing protein [[Clostridium] nexile]MCB7556232.1 SH3 domain-containing protein [[Clostridium] nexile]MCC3674263.1 SH3 domain-containing protein [[Clostridium] nexile]NSD84309.1 SH3 domain-containing protein [[Clostridium] nexile]NSD86763.1 SH3 domain-containing protein [[Clostridium] nexile]